MTYPMKFRFFVPVLGVAWFIAAIAGMGMMATYEARPGIAAVPSGEWPTGTRVQLAKDRPTLILLAHPQCPCTRASIGELNALLADCEGKVDVNVLFLKPKGSPLNWEKTDLWRSAAAIPGVKTMTDEGGAEARRFHASTSGQTLLFDKNGRLLFSGGITAGRGHSGDNAGRDAIVSWVMTGKAKMKKTAVFGCSLRTSTSADGAN